MARLYVGGPVPTRKVMRNPETVSGYPRWNTFQGLGMRSACTDLRIQASRAGVKTGGGRGKAKKLDPSNLCHRCKPKTDALHGAQRKHYEEARRLSLLLDRLDPGAPIYDVVCTNWGKHVCELMNACRRDLLSKLVEMESKRGQVRTRMTLKRGGYKL